MNPNEEIKEEEIPEELYAPLGDLTFKKPNTSSNENIESNENMQPSETQENKKEEIEPEILSYKDVKIEYAKKPFNTKKFITTIVTIIAILLFLVAAYLYQINNKNILRIGVNNIANTLEKTIYGVKESDFLAFNLNKPFRTSILLSFDATYDETKLDDKEIDFLKTMNDVAGSVTLDMDYQNKQFTHNIKATYLGGNIIDIYGNANEKGVTFKIKDVIGKYISYPIDNFKRFYIDPSDDKKEFDELKNIILKTLYMNVKEDDLTRKKITIKISDEKVKVKDVSLAIDNAYIQSILSKTINDLLNNEDFIEKTMNYTNLTNTRLKELMNELKVEIEKTNFVEDTLTFHIYSKGITNKIVGYKLEFTNNEKYDIEYLSYKNILSINIKQNSKDYFVYLKDTSNTKKYNYSVKYMDNILEMNRIEQAENILYEYTLNSDKTNHYTGTIIVTDEASKTSKDGNTRLTLTKLNENKEKVLNFYVTLNYNVKTLEKISLYDDTDAIDYKMLSADDKKEMKRRIENTEYFDLVKSKIETFTEKKS